MTEIDSEMVGLLEKAAGPHIWDEQPIFCFTSDIDWASEAVIADYFQLKVISFHPINMAFNTPYIAWMRQIKDSLTREEFNNISAEMIESKRNREKGAFDLVLEIINLSQQLHAPILTLNEIYQETIHPYQENNPLYEAPPCPLKGESTPHKPPTS